MSETLAIAGYGYCARSVAALWRSRGGAVVALDRFRMGAPDDVVAVRADLALGDAPAGLPAALGLVTMGTSEVAEVAGPAAAWLGRCGVRRAVYLSSTSVYGDREGGPVRGETPVAPDTRMGELRVAAEAAFRSACADAGVEAMVLRMPGIYGPNRTIRQRLEQGTYAFPAGRDRWTNRVHVDDVATAVDLLLSRGAAGGTYLASDGAPFRAAELVRWACETLGLAVPDPVAWDALSPRARAFWVGSRRCDPAELRELGWEPRFGDFRQGHLDAWRAEDAAR